MNRLGLPSPPAAATGIRMVGMGQESNVSVPARAPDEKPVTRAVLGVAARHGVVELRGSSGEQDVGADDVVGPEACCVFSC